MPWFSAYAAEALAMSGASAPTTAIDVASGPGTLSLLAVERGLRVTAIDFAPSMLQRLRASAERKGLRVGAVLADGESLPFTEGAFDAAFSMFGVIFFRHPGRGLSELLRVLEPGGVAVVSSWQPLETTPFLEELIAAFQSTDESFAFPDDALSQPGELQSAMIQAGFADVVTREATHSLTCRSLDELLGHLARSTPPFPMLRRDLSAPRWESCWAEVRRRLAARFGEGAQCLRYPAWLAAGRKPTV